MILSKYFTAGSNSTLSCALDASYLAVDHQCSKQDFPCDTIQILTDHCEEVWFCKFSPDGRKYLTLILNILKEIVVKNNLGVEKERIPAIYGAKSLKQEGEEVEPGEAIIEWLSLIHI